MTSSPPGVVRRWGAILLLRLTNAILRGATALYLRRVISAASLRAALSAASVLERAGAAVVLGRRPGLEPEIMKKDDGDARID
ncbi:MAG: hypothetical protein GY844_03250 [Bradyrhizobium sp.]|nr:hypothetical protein [Bradyrhizobium sp.]